MAGTSDKVTIEQGESVGLPDSDFVVVTMFDIEGRLRLVRAGSRQSTTPRGGFFLRGGEVRR